MQNEANEQDSILLSYCSFWFDSLVEKVAHSPTAGCVAPPLRTIELLSWRPAGFICGAYWCFVPRDATWCGATVKRWCNNSIHSAAPSLRTSFCCCSSSLFRSFSSCFSTFSRFLLALSIMTLRSLIFFLISERSWEEETPRAWNKWILTFESLKDSWLCFYWTVTSWAFDSWKINFSLLSLGRSFRWNQKCSWLSIPSLISSSSLLLEIVVFVASSRFCFNSPWAQRSPAVAAVLHLCFWQWILGYGVPSWGPWASGQLAERSTLWCCGSATDAASRSVPHLRSGCMQQWDKIQILTYSI